MKRLNIKLIESRMQDMGYTKRDLAAYTNSAMSSVQRWMKGLIPKEDKLRIICDKLNIERQYIIDSGWSKAKPKKTREYFARTANNGTIIAHYSAKFKRWSLFGDSRGNVDVIEWQEIVYPV